MNGFVYNLPPVQEEVHCESKDLQGYLEIEVSHISFITLKPQVKIQEKSVEKEENLCADNDTTDTPIEKSFVNKIIINNNNKNSIINKSISQELYSLKCQQEKEEENCNNRNINKSSINCVQVKFVWFGENRDESANLCISCESQQQQKTQKKRQRQQENAKLKKTTRGGRKRKAKYQQQEYLLLSAGANNTLRYRICTSAPLFLEYLISCKPIEIIVYTSTTNTTSSSTLLSNTLGQAQLPLPSVLIRKFNHNIAKGHNFEYKTKVYALYKHKQTNNNNNNKQLSDVVTLVKSGEIQLRFKMLFAPTAAAAVSAVAAKHSTNILHEEQLTSSLHRHHHHHNHMHGKSMVPPSVEANQGDIPKRLTSQSKSEEIVEAMKKLDAKLVAYLAGETEITSKLTNCEEENEVNMHLEHNNNNISNHHLDDLSPATKLKIFKSINGINLEMEALTLQPDGTKCMDLMKSEIRPIFTVECQLSNELIKQVPRHDMFHIMQFESEKFQSLTQCTRFGQQAQRSVKLDLNDDKDLENGNVSQVDFGRIHFTVWWREPGTCLNEMLGMGVLDLQDLYNASLLEQCKRIEIQRRGKHLACLYFKITLQRDLKSTQSLTQIKRELILPTKQSSADNDDDVKSPSTTDKKKHSSSSSHGQQQQTGTQSFTDKSSTEKASAQNNNVKIETKNFDDETSKIRLLKGFISANELRNLEISAQQPTYLICRRFWSDEPATAEADDLNKFNYQEQFSVINDDKFLQRVDKQYLHLELWHRMSCDDGNGNQEQNIKPIGIVRMPLHQFYIAYRDSAITNHLCKGKLPVISIDAWAPIINCQSGLNVGELKCLLAIGSEEQIQNLKDSRGISSISRSVTEIGILHKLQPLQIPQISANPNTTQTPTQTSTSTNNSTTTPPSSTSSRIKKTSDLLDMLQKVLMTPAAATVKDTQPSKTAAVPPTSLPTAETCTHPTSGALKPLTPSNVKLFKFSLEIQKAIGLPLNPASKAKKSSAKRNASKRFPPNEPPSCYVTFQADEGQYQTYKSHEGMVYATNIVEKSTQPQWQQRFRLAVTIDYLNNPQKRFILKVWKKSSLDIAQGRTQPTPMEDAIIGFSALDLTIFVRGLHIGGSFNIVDFNGRINGQLVVRCQPLEEIPITACTNTMISTNPSTSSSSCAASAAAATASVDSVIDQFEQTLDLTHLNLGQAIKRKFTELEGISQRLRARLGDVTGTELNRNFDIESLNTWQPLGSDQALDNEFDEFENDLNTTPPVLENEDEANKNQGKSQTDNAQTSE